MHSGRKKEYAFPSVKIKGKKTSIIEIGSGLVFDADARQLYICIFNGGSRIVLHLLPIKNIRLLSVQYGLLLLIFVGEYGSKGVLFPNTERVSRFRSPVLFKQIR